MVQFPFTNYKTVSIARSGSGTSTEYTTTARSLIVMEATGDNDNGNTLFIDAVGTTNKTIIAENDGVNIRCYPHIIPSGRDIKWATNSGTTTSVLHIFELP